jgi:hypothetical protein
MIFSSCEYETLPTYSGEDQIYFRYADYDQNNINALVNYTMVNFGYDPVIKTDSTIKISVKIMGKVVDYDRPVSFVLDEELADTLSYTSDGSKVGDAAQLGEDVELLLDQSFVPAGKTIGSIVIKLKNTARLKDSNLVAAIQLVENTYFKADYKTTRIKYVNDEGKIVGTQYLVLFDNRNDAPNLWVYPSTKQSLDRMFGAYSTKKFKLICELFGLNREYFTYDPETETASTVFGARFPIALAMGWATAFNRYLDEYKTIHGEPILEEDGTEMKGSASWF